MSADRKLALLDVMSGDINLTTNQKFQNWPEFEALRHTVQDKDWHAEGNVMVHTEMALNECSKIHIEARHQRMLYLSALLHDIAKPQTTKYSDNDE